MFKWADMFGKASSELKGNNSEIEVYDRIYYRYADPDYSITEMPLQKW